MKNKQWIVIRRELEEVDRSKSGNGPFRRKQENAAQHGAKLRGLVGNTVRWKCFTNAQFS